MTSLVSHVSDLLSTYMMGGIARGMSAPVCAHTLTHACQLSRLSPMASALSFSEPASREPAPNEPAAPSRAAAPHTAPTTRRDPALDGLRGLAVLMIFIFHYGGGLQSSNSAIRLCGYITSACWTGVILFFALSGFLITGSLWDSTGQSHRLRNFYVRRALRVLPLYFLALAAAAGLAFAHGATFTELRPLAIFVVFLQDVPHLATYALNSSSPLPLYHLWTIAVEEQFYLLWPLILLFAHSRRHALRLSVWFFGITWAFLLSVYTLDAFAAARTHHSYDHFLLTQGSALALGAAVSLAMGSRSGPSNRKPGSSRIIRKWALPAFFIGIGVFLFASGYGSSLLLKDPIQFWLGLPAISITAAAAIPLVLRSGIPRSLFSWSPLGWLGRISYGFYIFHILLQPFYDHLAANVSHSTSGDYYQAVRLIFAFVITCIVSWLSFHLLELPLLSLKRFFPLSSSLPWGEPIVTTHSSRLKRKQSSV
jgi:peptidoglycan/LPS O-acetylase OafA/YrhL